MMEWSESLSVGEPTLDAHHRRLFELLAELDRLTANGGLEAVRAVLNELNRYIAYHFAEEEAIMERAGFPFFELHRHSHRTIALRIADMTAALTADNVAAAVRELHDFLNGWLIHHIEIEDFEYRPFVTGES